MATDKMVTDLENEEMPVRRTALQDLWLALRRSRMAMLGVGIIAFFVLVALIGPFLAPYNPTAVHLSQRLLPPSLHHLFGTDEDGLDIFSRVIYGARIDLLSSTVIVLAAGTTGSLVGMIAAWVGGWWQEVLMRITDMFLAFPSLILAMAISAVLTPDLINALLAISVTYWPIYARISRAQTLAVMQQEYIESARSTGMSTARILWRHVFPNAFTPLLVQASLDMGTVLLLAAGLSFIGFGAQPPTPEWGLMVSSGKSDINTQWWISTFPAMAILFLVIGFNLIGDALRDALDPRMRAR